MGNERLDALKRCSTLTAAGERASCEVLVNDCSTQQEKGSKVFELTGPGAQKRRYQSIAMCYDGALAMPKQLGPLPASRLSSAAKPADTTTTAPDYSVCSTTTADAGTSCRALVDACTTPTTGPIVLHTDHGDFTADSPQGCTKMVRGLTFLGYRAVKTTPIQNTQGARQNHETQTSRSESTGQGGNVQPPPSQPQSGDVLAKARCDSLQGEKADRCRAIAAVCDAKPVGPYTLQTDHGSFTADDRKQCGTMTLGLVALGYRSANAASANGTSPDPSPNAAQRLLRTFSALHLQLRITGSEYREEETDLIFSIDGSLKGIPIRIRYALSRTQNDRFLMRYSIVKRNTDATLGGEQTIEFSAPGNRPRLSFEVGLGTANDFTTLQGIRVVERD